MNSKYRINIKTDQIIKDQGNLGISFYSPDWKEATSVEVKAIELKKLKEAKMSEVKAKRDKDLSEDVEVKQGTFQHSATSDINLIGYKECLEIGCKSMISWKLKNNIKVKLTTEIINDWLKAIAKQRSQVFQDYFDLKEKIDNAKTISTLNKIIIK